MTFVNLQINAPFAYYENWISDPMSHHIQLSYSKMIWIMLKIKNKNKINLGIDDNAPYPINAKLVVGKDLDKQWLVKKQDYLLRSSSLFPLFLIPNSGWLISEWRL